MKRLLSILALSLLLPSLSLAHELDVHAQAIEMIPPTYPELEKKEGRKGIATAFLRIDERGAATIERVMASESYKFVDATTAAAKTWTFKPSRRDGKPAPDTLEFIVVFDPKDGVQILGPLYPR